MFFYYSDNHFSALHLPVLVHAWQKNDFQSNQTNNVLNFYRKYKDSYGLLLDGLKLIFS